MSKHQNLLVMGMHGNLEPMKMAFSADFLVWVKQLKCHALSQVLLGARQNRSNLMHVT